MPRFRWSSANGCEERLGYGGWADWEPAAEAADDERSGQGPSGHCCLRALPGNQLERGAWLVFGRCGIAGCARLVSRVSRAKSRAHTALKAPSPSRVCAARGGGGFGNRNRPCGGRRRPGLERRFCVANSAAELRLQHAGPRLRQFTCVIRAKVQLLSVCVACRTTALAPSV